MKKHLLITSAALLLGLVATGCDKQPYNSNSEEDSTSENHSSSFASDSSSEEKIIVKDFKEALTNTRYYSMSTSVNNPNYISEFYSEDFYYKATDASGYFISEEDSEYVHSFSCSYDSSSNVVMSAYGRSTEAKNFSKIGDNNFLSVIAKYVKTFEKVSDTEYTSADLDLCYAVAYFFESKGLQSITSITFTINEKGRLATCIGSDGDNALLSIIFKDANNNDVSFYQNWLANGSKITTRVSDLKNMNSAFIKQKSLYDGETVKFEAVVTGIDDNGDVYVANTSSNGDYVGIRIEGVSSGDFKISDNVEVEAKITTANNIVYGINGKITYISQADYIPTFSEEAIVDSYGGGYYAYNYFSSSDYYADSLYTTYAYVSSLPEMVEGKDTVITLAFPAISNNTSIFYASLILPSYLSKDYREETYTTLKNADILGNEDAYLLCFDSVVLRMNGLVKGFSLQLLPTSSVYKKLTVAEKVEKICGLKGFSLPVVGAAISYSFGKGTQYELESQFGIETNDHKKGLFIGQEGFSEEEYNKFIANFETLGVSKYDEIPDKYLYRHSIYTYNGYIFDILYVPASWSAFPNQISIWIYSSSVDELIRTPSIEDRIKTKAPWFDVTSFLKYKDTYDADYALYEIDNFASKKFDEPLITITLDLNENVGEDYKRTLVQSMGYKQYKIDGKSYTYKTRGQVHYVFQKEEGQFLDVATYPTSDYIYTGHKRWSYRTEILLYRGTSPLEIPSYSDFTKLGSERSSIDESLCYSPDLPSDAKVEVWENENNYDLLKYGYGQRNEAFVYSSDLDEVFESIKSSVIAAGYTISPYYDEYTEMLQFEKVYEGKYYYVYMMKTDRFVRVINDLIGCSFYI